MTLLERSRFTGTVMWRRTILATTAPLVLTLALAACEVGPDYQSPSTTLAPFHNAGAVDARGGRPRAAARFLVDGFQRPRTRYADRPGARTEPGSGGVHRPRAAGPGRSTGRRRPSCCRPSMRTVRPRHCVSRSTAPWAGSPRTCPAIIATSALTTSARPRAGKSISSAGCGAARRWPMPKPRAASAELAGTRITIAADVADAYFQVRGDQARISVVEQQIGVDAHLLDLLHQLRGRGLANEREVSQAEAVLQQAEAALPLLKIALESQLNRFGRPARRPARYLCGRTGQGRRDRRDPGHSRCRQADGLPAPPAGYHRGRAAACSLQCQDRRRDLGLLSEAVAVGPPGLRTAPAPTTCSRPSLSNRQ